MRIIAQSQAAAARAEHLVQQLLGFSRKRPLQPKSLDCNAVVGDLREMLERPLPTGIHLTVAQEPTLWRTRADRKELETALLNLVVNARDAMQVSGGQVTVRTANVTLDPATAVAHDIPAGDYVEVRVADTGSGIPVAVLAHVFEPFYTTKAPGKGIGLGLSQVYGLAKQSDGGAVIETSEGKGTTVRLLLPRDTAERRSPA
jgi:signal transduction histidine kinase